MQLPFLKSAWATLFRLFQPMPEPNPVSVLGDYGSPRYAKRFFGEICDVESNTRSEYTVNRIEWCKEHSDCRSAEHEYLVAVLDTPINGTPGNSEPLYIISERRPPPDANSKRHLSSSSPKSAPLIAHDGVQSHDGKNMDDVKKERKPRSLATFTLRSKELSLLEWARILFVASAYSDRYNFANANCYFYSLITFKAAQRLFPGEIHETPDFPLAGKFKNVPVPILPLHTDPHVEEVVERYKQHYSKIPKPIGPAEQRGKEQGRMEGREEGRKEGRKEGIAIGEERGEERARQQMAKKMNDFLESISSIHEETERSECIRRFQETLSQSRK